MVLKRLADLLTLSRVFAAVAIVWLGVTGGPASLGWVAGLLLYSWTSDFFDGPLARQSGVHHSSWIGEHDLEVDVVVSAGIGVWLVAAGYVPGWLGGAYALLWVVAFGRLGVQRALGMLAQAPIYAWFLGIALRDAFPAGAALASWVLAVVVATWPRLPREVVPEFVTGMRMALRPTHEEVPEKPLPILRSIRPLQEPPAPSRIATGEGAEPRGTPAQAPEPLTLMSANLWHDWPRGRRLRERLEAFARLVEQERVDVILLQEVMRGSALHADEWLADRLGMAYAYTRANGHRAGIGFEEGVAVFSRFPLGEARAQQLGTVPGRLVRRLALGVQVGAPGGAFWAFSVHLSLRPWRNRPQVRHLIDWVERWAGSEPAVIAGDFNAPEGRPQIVEAQRAWLDPFRDLHPGADGATFERGWAWGPMIRRRLDYVFLRAGERSWRPLEAMHLEAPGGGHSDHRAVLVRVAPA